jgi:hypothetical protein
MTCETCEEISMAHHLRTERVIGGGEHYCGSVAEKTSGGGGEPMVLGSLCNGGRRAHRRGEAHDLRRRDWRPKHT